MDTRSVIFRLKEQLFSIPVDQVREMVSMPGIATIPNAPGHVRGAINLRGQIVPVIDLRIRLGMKSVAEETADLVEMLKQREQDHKNWLAELHNCIENGREFRLATDPRKCAFGKWYYAYKPDSLLMEQFLRKFEAPHKAIHEIAHTVIGLSREHRRDEAFAILQKAEKAELALLVGLFGHLRQNLSMWLNREIAVILQSIQKPFAVAVDAIESVEELKELSPIPLQSLNQPLDRDIQFTTHIGKRVKDNNLVIVVETERLLDA